MFDDVDTTNNPGVRVVVDELAPFGPWEVVAGRLAVGHAP